MRKSHGMSLIGLLISVVIMLLMMYMMLSSVGDELGPTGTPGSSGMKDLIGQQLLINK